MRRAAARVKSHARLEILGIALFVGVIALVRAKLPSRVEVGDGALGVAALLLAQGLVRDVVKLRAARVAARGGQGPRITCVCAESTLGVAGILAGAWLAFALSPVVVRVPPLAWPALAAFVTSFGFVTRHLVFDWRAGRLRWEADHDGVVVWKH